MSTLRKAQLGVLALLTVFGALWLFAKKSTAGAGQMGYLPFVSYLGQAQSPTPTPQATVYPTATRPPVTGDAIVVDHTSVDLFEQIPESYINAAANLDMIFLDRSVGGNISEGLECLSYPTDEASPNHCTRINHVVSAFSVDPSVINWSRSGGYPRDNWDYQYWPASGCHEWAAILECFMQIMNPIINQYDVVSFQYSYLAVDEYSTIADQPGGFFWQNANRLDVYDLEDYEAQHPNQIFIYWTTSLSRSTGSSVSDAFNGQMRDYAISNEKVLFDVADILSHDPEGNPCYDNRDGVPYDNGNNAENYPDDGQNRAAICQHYTTETDGGHLGSVSAGKIRVAKAFWVLMARIAGWDNGTQ